MSHALALLLGLFISAGTPMAWGSDHEAKFQAALKSLQADDLSAACLQLKELNQENPDNPPVLHNLGYCEDRQGQLGSAMARWRRAVALDPYFSGARQSIEIAGEKLKVKQLPHRLTAWEGFRKTILVRVDSTSLNFATWLGFLFFGLQAIRQLGAYRRARASRDRLSPWSASLFVWGLLFLGFSTLSLSKWWDLRQPRGTIILEKVEARTGPGPNETPLFDLFEGLDVRIEDRATWEDGTEWRKVAYPGGMTGWIPESSLLQTSGKNL